MYEFNDTKPAGNSYRAFPMMDIVSPSWVPRHAAERERERLVDIHAWCLMGNHYHLLISEIKEGGLSAFLRKLNVGYAKYFNERYRRAGTLFQGRTKKILIRNDAHFLHILHYIHLNPLDFNQKTKEWRTGRLSGHVQALQNLKKHRWSSFLDYCGQKNFPSVITRDLFGDIFGNYDKTIAEYLRTMDSDIVNEYTLE